MFNAIVEASRTVDWTREYFARNGDEYTTAIVGISGGIDSTVVAAICGMAIGPNRVIGIQLPQGVQEDFDDATRVINYLSIPHATYNIGSIMDEMYLQISKMMAWNGINDIVRNNTPARIRMAALYIFANQFSGRVANTCNLSETYVGYDTKWGDNAGDFAPIAKFTKSEVKQIAYALDIPRDLIEKPSHDGMCGQTDEDRWGFTYAELDAYIRNKSGINSALVNGKIEQMHRAAKHKIDTINLPTYPYYDRDKELQEYLEFGNRIIQLLEAPPIILLLGE